MKTYSVDELESGVRAGDRAAIGRALTLVESNATRHRADAEELLIRLLRGSKPNYRVGLTGVPGAGKSTFLETLGMQLIERGSRVAVLAVDPSSQRSGGSILGDKTRMNRLSRELHAFVRPSPSGGALGGVARKTREQIVVCEAAGYDVVFVETVGVGQSEYAVASMVDTFVLLSIPNAGDELQGIKRGIVELADIVVVNKADGDRVLAARRAASEMSAALRYMTRTHPDWETPVLTASAQTGERVESVWDAIIAHHAALSADGSLERRRATQRVDAMWSTAGDDLLRQLRTSPRVIEKVGALQARVAAGEIPPAKAAAELLTAFLQRETLR